MIKSKHGREVEAMSWDVWSKATILVWKAQTLLVLFHEVISHKYDTSRMLPFLWLKITEIWTWSNPLSHWGQKNYVWGIWWCSRSFFIINKTINQWCDILCQAKRDILQLWSQGFICSLTNGLPRIYGNPMEIYTRRNLNPL